MKLMHHELTRLQKYATLTLALSPDKKTDATKKDVAEFCKDLLNTVAQKRHIHHWRLILVEADKEEQ